MLILLLAPACVLSFYLAFLCYRKALYQHTLVLALIAFFMLFLTVGMVIAGYLMGLAIKIETASIILPGCLCA